MALQAWLVDQVVAHQFGWLTAERERRLEALGVDWADMAQRIRGRANQTRQ